MRPGAHDFERQWWENRTILGLVVVAMGVPLLWPAVPPLVDLLGHIGRYRVQLDLGTSPYLAGFYGFRWALIGNLGVDLLVMPLAPLIGLEPAVKAIVLAIPVLTTIGVLLISREIHGRVTPAVFLALPFVYGHPFQFGFVNFALGIGLALLAFALWLNLGRRGALRLRSALFIPIGLVLWVTHSFAWGVLGLLCFSADLVRERDAGRGWLMAAFHAGLHCIALAPPLVLMLVWRSDTSGAFTGDWFNFDLKQVWMMTALRDRWMAFDLASIAFAIAALIWAVLRRELEFSRNLGASAVILLLAFLCLPRIIFGSAYADMRLIPYVFLVAFLAVRPSRDVPGRAVAVFAAVGLAFLVARLGAHTASFYKYDQLHRSTLAALNHIPDGARMVTFVGRKIGLPWYTDRQEHISALAIARKHAFSNDQWVAKGAQLLYIRKPDARGFDRDPSQLVKPEGAREEPWRTQSRALARFPREAFDYVWLITPHPFDPALIADLELVWRNDRDALYRVRRPR